MLVFFVTGCSRGLGSDLCKEILSRGDRVVASGRSVDKLKHLEALGAATFEWDVTWDRQELYFKAEDVIKIYGRIDVVINSAGYILEGALEECSAESIQAQFQTNVFGLLNTTNAFLPQMRVRKSGTVVNLGSIGGWKAYGSCGFYCASKFAVRGFSEAMKVELEPLGIRVLLVELGFFRTDFLENTGARKRDRENRIPDYDAVTEQMHNFLNSVSRKQEGDPKKAVKVMIDAVKAEGVFAGRPKPGTLTLGADAYQIIGDAARATLDGLDGEFKKTTFSTGHTN